MPLAEVDRLLPSRENHNLSTRNRLPGIVREVKLDGLLAQVEIETSGADRIVAVITREAAEELGLEAGQPATALVKATSVMVER